MDNETVAAGAHPAFAFVKCFKPNAKPTTVTFKQPEQGKAKDAFRLASAACVEGDDHCTRDAADAWNRSRAAFQ